jgi:hypothetical protein
MDKHKIEYSTITIEAARTGWIVKERGKPAEVFVRWESMVKYIETRLSTKGNEQE